MTLVVEGGREVEGFLLRDGIPLGRFVGQQGIFCGTHLGTERSKAFTNFGPAFFLPCFLTLVATAFPNGGNAFDDAAKFKPTEMCAHR